MDIPDYGACVTRIAEWIAAEADLLPGKTIFLEPGLPEGPDGCAAIFETGGDWNFARGLQTWALVLVVRAARLADARALALACLKGAVKGFETATAEQRGIILDVKLEKLPSLEGRDERGRVILQAALTMTIHAPME